MSRIISWSPNSDIILDNQNHCNVFTITGISSNQDYLAPNWDKMTRPFTDGFCSQSLLSFHGNIQNAFLNVYDGNMKRHMNIS